MSWRRLADWKHEVTLVHRSELGALTGGDPVARLRPHAPALADALEQAGFVRVEPPLQQRLLGAGAVLWTVGYHRGVDALELRMTDAEGVEIHALEVATLELDDLDALDDVVDAVLRLWTEDQLTEAAVLLAAAAPALRQPPEDIDGLQALDPTTLPRASDAQVDAVARALATHQPAPRTPGPVLSAEERRGHLHHAGAVVAVAAVVAAVGALWSQWVPVFVAPIAVLYAVIALLHGIALYQGR